MDIDGDVGASVTVPLFILNGKQQLLCYIFQLSNIFGIFTYVLSPPKYILLGYNLNILITEELSLLPCLV